MVTYWRAFIVSVIVILFIEFAGLTLIPVNNE
jgi:hypothetical protein